MARRALGARVIFGTVTPKPLDWYVDSVNGNDGYSGRSPTQAFASIAAVEAVLSPGEGVGLARGSHWREQFDVSADGVSVVAYGVGPDPLLDCSDPISSGAWSKTGGYTNVYQCTVSPDLSPTLTWVQCYEDGANLERVGSIAECDTTPGSYYPSSDTTAPITLYVHTSGSDDPATNGKTYDFSARKYGFYCYGAADVSITGIHTRRNLSDSGSVVMGRNGVVDGCTVSDGGFHNCLVRDGCTLTGTTLDEAYRDVSASMLVLNEDTPASQGVTVRNCAFTRAAVSSGKTGISGHHNTSGDFGTVTIEGCTFENLSTVMQLNDAILVIKNCTATNCINGLKSNARTISITIDGLTVDTDEAGAQAVSIQHALSVIAANMDITIRNSVTGGAIYVTAGATLKLTNSLFTCTSVVGQRVSVFCSSPGADLTLTDNIFSANWNQDYNFTAGASGMAWESDRNCFEDCSTSIFGTTYATLAEHQAGTGQDLNSTEGGCV